MQKAEHIWHDGMIETLNPAQPRADSLAIADGRIIAVGTKPEVMALSGPGTKLHDLGGRYVMPGLVESHTHAVWGGCRDLFDAYVGFGATIRSLLDAVQERATQLSPSTVIQGGPWSLEMRSEMGAFPRKMLDSVVPDHPVALYDMTHHSLWCNSRALELAGLSSDHPDIPGGEIERDAHGAPNGILHEAACVPVGRLCARSEAQLAEAVRYFTEYFNRMGITAFKEPMALEHDLRAYHAADLRGEMTLHAAAHITRSGLTTDGDTPYEIMDDWRKSYASENLRTGFAKLFLDGVAASRTSSFLEAYAPAEDYAPTGHEPNATLILQPDELNDTVTELDRRGYVVKMHAVGDNAVRAGLNAVESARKRNGASGLRHELAHCGFVHPDDHGRFAELGAVAEISPKLWFPNPVTATQRSILGEERADRCHPIRSLLEAGAELTYASDWPAAAPDANPWVGLAGMISRRDPTGRFPGTVGRDQAIPLAQALPIFTRNGARALGMEGETGILAPGCWADFIVLERDLATLTPEEIAAIEICQTYWKGRQVY